MSAPGDMEMQRAASRALLPNVAGVRMFFELSRDMERVGWAWRPRLGFGKPAGLVLPGGGGIDLVSVGEGSCRGRRDWVPGSLVSRRRRPFAQRGCRHVEVCAVDWEVNHNLIGDVPQSRFILFPASDWARQASPGAMLLMRVLHVFFRQHHVVCCELPAVAVPRAFLASCAGGRCRCLCGRGGRARVEVVTLALPDRISPNGYVRATLRFLSLDVLCDEDDTRAVAQAGRARLNRGATVPCLQVG